MGSWFQWLVDWVSASLWEIYEFYTAFLLTALAQIIALVPGAPPVDSVYGYLEAANVWVPISEALVMLSAFFSWRTGYISVKVLRTFIPTIR
jgi:hypothetical protein